MPNINPEGEVKQEFESLLIKRKELITRLENENVFESVVSNPENICEEFKNSLQEEIAYRIRQPQIVSEQVEEKPQQQIAATQGGKAVITNERSNNTEASIRINQLHDKSKQNGISVHEAQITSTIQDQSVCYNRSSSSTIDDSASPRYSPKLLSYVSDKQILKQSTEDLVSIIKELIMMIHSISSDNSQGCSIAVRKVSGRYKRYL